MTAAQKQTASQNNKPAPVKARKPTRVLTEAEALHSLALVKKILKIEVYIIAFLSFVLAVLLPIANPIYLYFSLRPDGKSGYLSGLGLPNMTNKAVISWATNSITEIMTVGFGDIDSKTPQHKNKFTPEGWESYMKAFELQNVAETIKKNQLVVTAVPANTPVILGQGINEDQTYQWVVQMPVITTYSTNNNITQQRKPVITLLIVRTPTEGLSSGIAIKRWIGGNG